MRLAITGGTGLVGRFLVEEALGAGDTVTLLSRTPPTSGFFSGPVHHVPWDLSGPLPALGAFDALIHAAFSHIPGHYRGGEGDDPDGFLRANLAGSVALFEAARSAGVTRLLFLSSRAVYGAHPPGSSLHESMPTRPDTLYGQVKVDAELALSALSGPGFATASLRATGIYGPAGPGHSHKWADLFAAAAMGRSIAPRVATEVHGNDLAAAVRLLLNTPPDALGNDTYNVSDILLDRRDLLAEAAALANFAVPLPDRADPSQVSVMDTTRLRALGWRPGGLDALRDALPELLTQSGLPLRTG